MLTRKVSQSCSPLNLFSAPATRLFRLQVDPLSVGRLWKCYLPIAKMRVICLNRQSWEAENLGTTTPGLTNKLQGSMLEGRRRDDDLCAAVGLVGPRPSHVVQQHRTTVRSSAQKGCEHTVGQMTCVIIGTHSGATGTVVRVQALSRLLASDNLLVRKGDSAILLRIDFKVLVDGVRGTSRGERDPYVPLRQYKNWASPLLTWYAGARTSHWHTFRCLCIC